MKEYVLTSDKEGYLRKLENLLKHPRLFLSCCCVWPENNSIGMKVGLCYYIALGALVLIGQHIFLYKYWGEIELMIATYSTLITVLQMVSKLGLLVWYKDLVLKSMNTVRHEFWPIDSLYPSYWKTCRIGMTLFQLYGWGGMICVQVWMFFPFADALPGQRQLPLLCWFPFDPNRDPVYQLIYFHFYMCGLLVAFGCLGYDALFGFFIIMLVGQYRMLKMALRALNRSGGNTDEHQAYDEMIFCIKHHQTLSSFCKDLRKMFNVVLVIQLSTNTVSFCAFMYLVPQESDIQKQIKLLQYICTIGLQLSVYCISGTILEAESESVAQAAYECNWYEAHPRLRLGLIRIIQMAKQPQRLSAAGMVYINNTTMVQVYRTAFSIATLLDQMQE